MEIITELHKTNKTWICEGGIVRNKMQVKKLKEICETYKPKNILEIGFNGGHSSALMLEHTDACIVSVDICSHHYVFDAKEKIDDIFPERHILIEGNSMDILAKDIIPNLEYDLIFIDGGHSYKCCKSDIINCKKYASSDTIVIVDDIVYDDEYIKSWNKQVTKVWCEMKQSGFVQELDYFYFEKGSGFAVGTYK